ncbi:hypothetical protein Tco_1084335 [Tanacetum coccineum]
MAGHTCSPVKDGSRLEWDAKEVKDTLIRRCDAVRYVFTVHRIWVGIYELCRLKVGWFTMLIVRGHTEYWSGVRWGVLRIILDMDGALVSTVLWLLRGRVQGFESVVIEYNEVDCWDREIVGAGRQEEDGSRGAYALGAYTLDWRAIYGCNHGSQELQSECEVEVSDDRTLWSISQIQQQAE